MKLIKVIFIIFLFHSSISSQSSAPTLDTKNQLQHAQIEQLKQEIKFLSKQQEDLHTFFSHILTAITIIFLFVGIFMTYLSFSSKSEIKNAIQEMERKFEVLSNKALKKPFLNIYADGKILDNSTVEVSADKNNSISFSHFYLRNFGDGITRFVSAKFYFSIDIEKIGGDWWEKQKSTLEEFSCMYYYGADVPVSPKESWTLPVYKGRFKDNIEQNIRCRLEVFYGNDEPATADFMLSVTSQS